jgi:hypothetical protein
MSLYSAEARSVKVAERAAEAWYQSQGSSNYDVAVGVVAALALAGTGLGIAEENDVRLFSKVIAKEVLKGPDEYIAHGLMEIWTRFFFVRPDLGRLVGPFADWLNKKPGDWDKGLVRGAANVARAAVKAGLLDLAGLGLLTAADVIGPVYLHMRSDGAKQARGEFYTPPAVCKTMARMIIGKHDLKPGMSLCEPSAGTGGMIRAAAEHLRECCFDPADFWWVANDISHVAMAGLAVNAYLWGLGPHVILGVADTLREPLWPDRAREEQLAAYEERGSLASWLKWARAFHALESLIAGKPAAAAPAPRPLPAATTATFSPLTASPSEPVPAPAAKPHLPMPEGKGIQLSLLDEEDEGTACQPAAGTPAPADEASPAPQAAGPAARNGNLHGHCTLCGFSFGKPVRQSVCRYRSACEKRRAARAA